MANTYKYSKHSWAVLDSCHPDLKKIALLGLQWSAVDISLVEGHRSKEKQKHYYDMGLSKCDGTKVVSKHNYYPSLALDFRAYVPGYSGEAYGIVHLSYIAGLFSAAAAYLLSKKEISHRLRWGANWDGDGVLMKDQSFQDLPHIELIPIK